MKEITEEIQVYNGSRRISGIAYVPETAEDGTRRFPLILFSHELGKNHKTGIPYAKFLVKHGYAVYLFDFCGGSRPGTANKSDGELTRMSVKTECRDLECVLAAAKNWDFADPQRIVLIGASQGGFVSAAVAAKKKEMIAAMILMYPALLIFDDVHRSFASEQDIPETFDKWNHWITLGRAYAKDAWNYDPYQHIGGYRGPVLILHGNRDKLVDLSYSRRAAETFQNAEFHVIQNGAHGFYGQPFKDAVQYIQNFLDRQISAEYDNTGLTITSHQNKTESEVCNE